MKKLSLCLALFLASCHAVPVGANVADNQETLICVDASNNPKYIKHGVSKEVFNLCKDLFASSMKVGYMYGRLSVLCDAVPDNKACDVLKDPDTVKLREGLS